MTTPTEIIEEVRQALATRNYKAFAASFTEDGVYERPYAPKGTSQQYAGVNKIYDNIETGMASANKLFEIINVEVKAYPRLEKDVVSYA